MAWAVTTRLVAFVTSHGTSYWNESTYREIKQPEIKHAPKTAAEIKRKSNAFPLSRSKTPRRVEKPVITGAFDSLNRRTSMAKKPKGGRKGGKGC